MEDDTTPPFSDALGQAVDETASQEDMEKETNQLHGGARLKRYGKMCINYGLPIQNRRSHAELAQSIADFCRARCLVCQRLQSECDWGLVVALTNL